MEIRLGLAARATKDLDIGLCLPSEDVLAAFDTTLAAIGYAGFRLRRRGEAILRDNGARKLQVRLEYLENAFATIDVDLAPASPETETDRIEPFMLADLGLAAPRAVPLPCDVRTDRAEDPCDDRTGAPRSTERAIPGRH